MKPQEHLEFNIHEGNETGSKAKTFGESQKEQQRKLSTVAAGEYAKEKSVYTDENGLYVIVPAGWIVSGLKKENIVQNNGVVLYKMPEEVSTDVNWVNENEVELIKKTYTQFTFFRCEPVYNPQCCLHSWLSWNRYYKRANAEFYEPQTDEFSLMEKSFKKCGGVYISTYNISINATTGIAQSVKGVMPMTCESGSVAKKIAASVEESTFVKSHLLFGTEYDSVLEWMLKSAGVNIDSEIIGNYINNKKSVGKIAKTGTESIANLCDFFGNLTEWTQELNSKSDYTIRGGCFKNIGNQYPVSYRDYAIRENDENPGFRAALCIE